MEINTVKLVCFSPTGTTRTIANAVVKAAGFDQTELIDITLPAVRKKGLRTKNNELLIVAAPVYMGRLPALVSNWLNALHADNTPAVCMVVYGNRAYENALLELKDMLKSRGCKPFAGAAFIGEHSFSSKELPSSAGRPDSSDLQHATHFGKQLRNSLQAVNSPNSLPEVKVPGSYPYGGVTNLWKLDFIAVSNACTQCGICAAGCPTGAIDPENSKVINIQNCTLCCACIKNCSQQAKSMKPGPMLEAAIRCTTFAERKEPEFYFSA